ncbi:MAG TPA: LL-diaminopimelate aminotransferase [Verrucomicrobia bacterium]|nr:LL-diaminopimelate aminotransferase [Verrucomicrobiales bacterium]HIL54326.1 LL-diaminopimelate aminotransferase [Verrucomicrobiota bacterium]
MAKLNNNYLKLKAGYLFPEIGRRVKSFSDSNPENAENLIKCGIGDVTEPLPLAARNAMKSAVDELGNHDTFRGYGPEQGYDFLRTAIANGDYRNNGISVEDGEIFVSDGSKCDTGNILDIFGNGNKIAITDPVYPVYVDTNVMAGNTGEANESGAYEGIHYMPCNAENGFVPEIPQDRVDLIYLCYPNNPTGATATREQLGKWVSYAREHGAVILYDAAYQAFIQDQSVPRSIYEIDGARECAIEFRSFSKNGGFTGVRCAFTVVPKELMAEDENGEKHSLHPLWSRRQSTKFNSVSYPVQKAAEALYSDDGKNQVKSLITHYMENAQKLRSACSEIGLSVYGGQNAPYVWVACPDSIDSWGMFDKMLNEANVVITPGAGFGEAGEGFFRISAFNSKSNVDTVCERLKATL